MGNQGIVYEVNRWHSPMCGLDQVSFHLNHLTLDCGICGSTE